MSSKFASFESEVLRSIKAILAQFSPSFDELELIPDVREISRSGEGSPKYESELTVYFWDAQARAQQRHDLIDIIEFHLVREGRIQASLDEITDWVEEAVQGLLRKRQIDEKDS